jgi:hypothetical protein
LVVAANGFRVFALNLDAFSGRSDRNPGRYFFNPMNWVLSGAVVASIARDFMVDSAGDFAATTQAVTISKVRMTQYCFQT